MSGPPTLPLRHDTRLAREEAEWMIQDMGWIPADCPAQGTTALMRARFNEAVAAFSLQAEVQAAVNRRHAVPALPPEANIAQEEVEIRSHSSTELVASDPEVCELTESEGFAECEFFNLPAADPPSPDRCEEEDRGGPPSPDPADQPDSKRQRPPSCLRCLSSPVLRQATALPPDGVFEGFAGLVLARSASVISPSQEMVIMAMFRAIQCVPMPDIRQLTACSKT